MVWTGEVWTGEVWTGDGAKARWAGDVWPAYRRDRAGDLWAGKSDQPGTDGPLLARRFGALVPVAGRAVRCPGQAMDGWGALAMLRGMHRPAEESRDGP